MLCRRRGGQVKKSIVRAVLVLAVASLVAGTGCSDSSPSSPSNNAPTITLVSVIPGTVSGGGIATVTVTAADSDGDALSYAYFPSSGAITGSGPVVTWTAPMTAGTYSVIVTVSDGNGGEVSGSGSLTVTVPVTTVQGTVALPGGVPGQLANGLVMLYASYNDWNNYTPAMTVTVVGTGTSVTYSITNVPPGTWYMDYWLDNDFSGFWSTGDFVAWYGSGTWGAPTLTPFVIIDGEVKTLNMTAVLIP